MTARCFVPNDLDIKKLWENTCEISACKRTITKEGGRTKTTIEVPILTCSCLWHRFQKEAEDWIAPGGVLIADPQVRNRKINAAYAQLWLADNRFQWAGLAAFASKQVGCGLLHVTMLQRGIAAEKAAHQKLRDAPAEILFKGLGFTFSRPDPKVWEEVDKTRSENPVPTMDITLGDNPRSVVQEQLDYVYEMLAFGNTALFLDVYPLHRFFMVRGYKEMMQCLESRREIANDVMWPLGNRVDFGGAHEEIFQAFKAIDAGQIASSVNYMAIHEQINILQPAMYENARFASLINATHAANIVSIVTGLLSGVPEGIQLTLANQCKVLDARSISFSRNPFTNLADKTQRMEFVLRAAAQFDGLLKTPLHKAQLENSIMDIANGNGVHR